MWLPLSTVGIGKSVPDLHEIDFHQQWWLLNGDYINNEASLTAGPLCSICLTPNLIHCSTKYTPNIQSSIRGSLFKS